MHGGTVLFEAPSTTMRDVATFSYAYSTACDNGRLPVSMLQNGRFTRNDVSSVSVLTVASTDSNRPAGVVERPGRASHTYVCQRYAV